MQAPAAVQVRRPNACARASFETQTFAHFKATCKGWALRRSRATPNSHPSPIGRTQRSNSCWVSVAPPPPPPPPLAARFCPLFFSAKSIFIHWLSVLLSCVCFMHALLCGGALYCAAHRAFGRSAFFADRRTRDSFVRKLHTQRRTRRNAYQPSVFAVPRPIQTHRNQRRQRRGECVRYSVVCSVVICSEAHGSLPFRLDCFGAE